MKALKQLSLAAKIGIGALVAIVAVVFLLTYQGSPNKILAVADTFQPDSSWVLKSDNVVPPAFFCPKACPEVVRTWERSTPVTYEELMAYIPDEWGVEIEGSCRTSSGASRNIQVSCGARGYIEKGDYHVYVRSRTEDSTNRIVISIRGG